LRTAKFSSRDKATVGILSDTAFTEHGGHFYLVAERKSANWVRNIQSQPQVKVRVGDAEFNAIARVVHDDREPQLAATVKALFDAKYGWSDGLIAELTPA
jgi:hypothetical protein